MTAEIISVGTELLLGNILNTNAQYLSRELAEILEAEAAMPGLAELEAEAAEAAERIRIRITDEIEFEG